MGDLSRHFSYAEFADRHTGQCQVEPALINGLELLRSFLDRPIVVTSGYRSSATNDAVGGAKGSFHLRGMAADISIPGLNVWEMYALASLVPVFANGGIGVYPEDGHLHVDVRMGPSRWAKLGGKELSIPDAMKAVKA